VFDNIGSFEKLFVQLATCPLAIVPFGCGTSLPAPDLAEHPRDSFVNVPYPPPAALSETVPERPASQYALWVDGDWTFRGHSYAWQRGGWLRPLPGARYARSQVFYLQGGRLMFAAGAWYDLGGKKLSQPEMLRPAATPANAFTSEFQTGR